MEGIRGYIMVALLRLTCVSPCRYDVINACFPHQPHVAINNTSGVFPYYSDAALNDLCSNHQAYTECMKPYLEHCPLSERRTLESKNAALSFLCSDKLPVYRSVRSCVASVESAHCNYTYTSQMAKLVDDFDTMHNKRLKLCRHTLGLVDCLRRVVNVECGAESSAWLHDMKMHLLSATLDELGCVHDDHLGPTAIIAIVVALVLAFVAIFVISAIFRRKATQHPKLPSFTSRQSSHKKSSSLTHKPEIKPVPESKTNGSFRVPGRPVHLDITCIKGAASSRKEEFTDRDADACADQQQQHVTNGGCGGSGDGSEVTQQQPPQPPPPPPPAIDDISDIKKTSKTPGTTSQPLNARHDHSLPSPSSDNGHVALSMDDDIAESLDSESDGLVGAVDRDETPHKTPYKAPHETTPHKISHDMDENNEVVEDSSDEYSAMLNETTV